MRPLALALVAVCAACAHEVADVAAARPPVDTGLFCWDADGKIPSRFGGMKVIAADPGRRRYILGRRGRTTLIGEVVPGIACVLSEGAAA